MAQVINSRMYMPLEEGETAATRKVMHPETNSSQVMIDPSKLAKYNGKDLTEYVNDTVHLVSSALGTDTNLNIKPSIENLGRPYTVFEITGTVS